MTCYHVSYSAMENTQNDCANARTSCESTCATGKDTCITCQNEHPVPAGVCSTSCSKNACYNRCGLQFDLNSENFLLCSQACDATQYSCQKALLPDVNCFPCETECAALTTCPAGCATDYNSCFKAWSAEYLWSSGNIYSLCESEYYSCSGHNSWDTPKI